MRPDDPEDDPEWAQRHAEWRGKLGRLRLGAEPLEDQLARCLRVTWGLTIVSLVIATMFVALFTAFGRPDVGGIVAGVVLLPVVIFAWIDYLLLSIKVDAYEADRRHHEAWKAELRGRS